MGIGMSRRALSRWVFAIVLVSLIGGVVLYKQSEPPALVPLNKRLTFAVPLQPSSMSVLVALDEGLFARHGLNVMFQPHALGAQGIAAVVNGLADVTLAADTPFMLNVMAGQDLVMLASVSNAKKALAIVGRRDRGVTSIQDLAGKRIGVVVGTNMQFFLSAMLATHNIAKSSVIQVALKPDELGTALNSGRVDAVTAWQPNLTGIQQREGSRATVFYGDDLFKFRFYLMSSRAFAVAHPGTVKALLAAISEANHLIREHPEKGRSALTRHLGMDSLFAKRVAQPEDFELRLDQSILLALDDQTRWAIRNGLIPATRVPNFLHFIHAEPLLQVDAAAVSLIR